MDPWISGRLWDPRLRDLMYMFPGWVTQGIIAGTVEVLIPTIDL